MSRSPLDRKVVQKPLVGRPHLVILGAGATLAAFPSGDKNGRKLPLMKNLVEMCGLLPILDRHSIAFDGSDFEAFFSALATSGQHSAAVAEIERALFDYFASMELPDEPTLYDHLVLSLRRKDVVATFNWDPFLFQALARNSAFAPMPQALILHGNVAIGCCARHRPVCVRPRGSRCQRCNELLDESRLLYPVARKNYNDDPFIAKMWELVQKVLRDAFVVTFFGYSAPKTDVEAVGLLQNGWGSPYDRVMEEIEIIDIKSEDEVCQTWNPFIHSHHYTYSTDFYSSLIASFPRRSCDAMFCQVVDAEFVDTNPLPRAASWTELRAWFEPIIADERDNAPQQPSE